MNKFINKVIQGDCLDVLKTLPENSVDSICCDPPYELGFMGKSWDNTGIANNVDMWAECLRVLKPGGHLLAFSGTRTYHRMASAIEDAGFEVRDMIEWVYGSGFPKSLNIGKAVDKLQGNKRELVGKQKGAGTVGDNQVGNQTFVSKNQYEDGTHDITKGTSEWEGWGTALKPAHEPICMARKPLAEKTVAENCLKWGTGGINIDESRVGTEGGGTHCDNRDAEGNCLGHNNTGRSTSGETIHAKQTGEVMGRFPANLIHDNSEEVRECFPDTKKGSATGYNWEESNNDNTVRIANNIKSGVHFGDSGNASRFFKSIIYTAKASKSERNKGCEELEEKKYGTNITPKEGSIAKYGYEGAKKIMEEKCVNKNNHPTVKPIALMEYLIKMVTPKGGIVLDPFAGSGSTLVAAKQNGYQYIGIELIEEYIPIIEARLKDNLMLFL